MPSILHKYARKRLQTKKIIFLENQIMKHYVLRHQTTEKKCKVHLRTGHEEPEGEQRYSPTHSLTSVLNRGGWSMAHSGRFTPPPERGQLPTAQEAEWAPGPVWTGKENLAPTEIRTPNRPVRGVVVISTALSRHRNKRLMKLVKQKTVATFEQRIRWIKEVGASEYSGSVP